MNTGTSVSNVDITNIEVSDLKSFYMFNGVYCGAIAGSVTSETIENCILTFDPAASMEALNMAVIDYDTTVYFIAIDMTNDSLTHFLSHNEALLDSMVSWRDFNSSNRPRPLSEVTKPLHKFIDRFVGCDVEKTPLLKDDYGIGLFISLTSSPCISVDTPIGFRATFELSNRAAREYLSRVKENNPKPVDAEENE